MPGGLAGEGGGKPPAQSDAQSVPPSSCTPVSLKHHTFALRAAQLTSYRLGPHTLSVHTLFHAVTQRFGCTAQPLAPGQMAKPPASAPVSSQLQ